MRSTVILTAATGSPAWAGPCVGSQAALAVRYGADFHIASHGVGETGKWESANWWTKLHALQGILKGHAYEHIVWMDADMMVNLGSFTDADWTTLTKPAFGLTVDPMATMDERYVTWATEKSGLPPCPDIVVGAPYYNAGLMSMCRNMAECYIGHWQRLHKHKPGAYEDQDFLNFLVACGAFPMTVLPRELNWMAVRGVGDTLRDAKIMHFSGLQKTMVAPFARM